MYPLSMSGAVPGLRAPAPGSISKPEKVYGDYYCSDCDVQWARMESTYCWSCGANLRPDEEEE